MANVTMNIESAVWASPGSVTFGNLAVFDKDHGGDVVQHSAGLDKVISSTKVVNIRGMLTIGFDDRVTDAALASKVDTEASMVIKVKDIDAATGVQYTAALARLVRVIENAAHNAPTRFSAIFFCRASDGSTSPVAAVAY
jgi:hypothetical protein